MPDNGDGHKIGDSPKREPISKKTRFEVFKRDSFTCAYCGRAAPEVVLHLDHIKPVATGGLSDILNLITACKDCNAGKGARPLTDRSTLHKQKVALDELNDRRQQLEMLVEWRESLAGVDDAHIEAISRAVVTCCDGRWGLDKPHVRYVRRWLKKHSAEILLEAVDEAFLQHFNYNSDKDVERQSWCTAFQAIPKVANLLQQKKLRPWLSDALYVRGILRNRYDNDDLDFFHHGEALAHIEAAFRAGASADSMKEFAKTTTLWRKFVAEVQRFCETSTAPRVPEPAIQQKEEPRAAPCRAKKVSAAVEPLTDYEFEESQREYVEWRDREEAKTRKPEFDWPELDEPFPELSTRSARGLRGYFEH